jgi:hypothetical protein
LTRRFPPLWSVDHTAAVPIASAKCQSERALFGVRSSLKYLVGNVESQNLRVQFK